MSLDEGVILSTKNRIMASHGMPLDNDNFELPEGMVDSGKA